jgi:hypothetical protein
MTKNLRIVLAVLAINAILILFFVSSSYAIANDFNSNPNDLLHVNWNFFGLINIVHEGYLVNGNYQPTVAYDTFYDIPFWLFFVSTAVNLFFIILLIRQKETKPKPT